MNIFKKKEKRQPRIINAWEHNTWGDAIRFMDWNDRRVEGFLSIRSKKGDILKHEMTNGKIGLFRFEEVDLKDDPPDMFFATVSDIGYEDEVDINDLK